MEGKKKKGELGREREREQSGEAALAEQMVSPLSPEAALYSSGKKPTKNKERETKGDGELKREFGSASSPLPLGRGGKASDGGDNGEATQSDVTLDRLVASLRMIDSFFFLFSTG